MLLENKKHQLDKNKKSGLRMNIPIDYSGITGLMTAAHGEGRNFLYEYEVYSLLSKSGAETPPKSIFLPRDARPLDEELMALPGKKAVLKIVSPHIIHKTEVGGVILNILNKKETPYLESKVINGSVECVIYAKTFNQFIEKAYFLETTIMDITIDDLKEIINNYYSIFQYNHFSAFGINQETYSWFGYGPLNFIKALEMQDFRYSSLRENNDYIHHREMSCFIDELSEAIFYIHSQPNQKDEPDELITLDYVNIGFLFNNIPFNHIYHRFFEKINSIPDVVREVDQALTVSKRIDYEFEKEGSIISNHNKRLGGWVCGIYGDNSNDTNITEIYNDKIMVNLRQHHEIKDKCRYKILSVNATTLPAGNFKATIINYKGDWEII